MNPLPRKPLFAIAHRGASALPENTVAAFDEAINLGAKAVEFDIRLTADNIPVVLHDATLDRTTTGKGPVDKIEWNDLLLFDAGSWKNHRFAGTRIPSLDEALLAIGPRARPVIELKIPLPPDLLLTSLRKYDLESEVLVISFEPAWLAAVRRASKHVPLGLLSDKWSPDLPNQAKALDADTLLLHTDCLGTSQIAAAEAQGLEVWCFTPNEIGLVAACAAMGVTGVITDYPDLIARVKGLSRSRPTGFSAPVANAGVPVNASSRSHASWADAIRQPPE